jgi:sugar lactone lactonase YvrE
MKKIPAMLIMTLFTGTGFGQQRLETVYRDDTYQFTGVAISAKGRLFVTYPRWEGPYKYAVVEVMKDGTARPFPDLPTNEWSPGQDGRDKWVCVQTAYVDDEDFLYIVDAAAPKLEKVVDNAAKVVKFNLKTNQIEQVYRFPLTIDNHSYLNDIRVDTKKQVAYLTNSGTGGIVILDLATGKSRQVLQNHRSVHPDPNAKFIIDGKELKKQGQPVAFQSDGIALTRDGNYLYYKTITDKRLNRVKTSALLDSTLTSQQLAAAVEDLGEVAHTDGMEFDWKGNLFMGDPTTYELIYVTPDHQPHSWIKSADLIWPDTYSVSKDGYLYVSTSQINKQPAYNDGVNKRTQPYQVFKVKLP